MGGDLVLVAFFHCLAGEEKEIARYESEFSNDSMAARVLPGLSLHNLGSSDKQREVPLAAKPQHTRSPHLLDSLTLALPATVSPLCYTGPFKPVHRNLCSPIHPRSTGFPLAFLAPPSVPPTMPLDQYSSHLPP